MTMKYSKKSLFLLQSRLQVDVAAERIQCYSADPNDTYLRCCCQEAIFVQTEIYYRLCGI
ncbi:hypothetical protein T4E_9143 [Trichinella pseudospiralis]|uniref:Uncharacterized protein n=1 Tax=Trichinella pseudospiralis TaxID=6337 RepID=A0A0V0XK64_TRIPS|nr:hypothetical protein T4E_9143 [Trichinella pseudospiralis]